MRAFLNELRRRKVFTADVNVGVCILRSFRMTVDFAENAAWLEPFAGQ